jgi:hypothetical protein
MPTRCLNASNEQERSAFLPCNSRPSADFGLLQDAASHKLEDQYFYVPENDHDQSRAELLVGLMPKKRGVTKQHHQYYFKPVPKVVEWDHEDEFN